MENIGLVVELFESASFVNTRIVVILFHSGVNCFVGMELFSKDMQLFKVTGIVFETISEENRIMCEVSGQVSGLMVGDEIYRNGLSHYRD
jgi:hypothetical protein